MQKLIRKLRIAFGQKKEMRQIVTNDSGFSVVEHNKTLAQVAWVNVREIFAYKEDRFTSDDICLGFRVDGDDSFWMVSEDFVGYKQLLAELEHRFPSIRTDWFSDVAFPAFVTNRTTIWGTSLTPSQK